MNKKKNLAVSIDIGGTKCEVMAADADGTVLRRVRTSVPDGERGRGAGRSEPAIRAALHEALSGLDHSVELQVAYNGSTSYMKPILVRLLPPDFRLRFVPEEEMALAIVGVHVGIVICSGTGSFVHACCADGRCLHLDSGGPVAGDYGSAYQVGQRALRAAYRSGWHERHVTSLAGVVYRAWTGKTRGPCDAMRLQMRERYELLDFQREMGRYEIAGLAPLVDREAARGDRIARSILEEASRDLGESLFDLVDTLNLAHIEMPLIGIGGNLVHSKVIWPELCEIAARLAPGLRPQKLTPPLALGGLLSLLAPAEDDADSEDLRRQLFRTVPPYKRDSVL